MALFPAGASFLVYYPANPIPSSSGDNMLGTTFNWINAAREGNITRLFTGDGTAVHPVGSPPSYPGNVVPPLSVLGLLPVGAIPPRYQDWGVRRLFIGPIIGGVFVASPWVEIADMVSIDPPMEKTGSAQTTVLKSHQLSREKIPGFLDGDTVKCKARHSRRLNAFLHNPPSGLPDGAPIFAAGGGVPPLVVPSGGLRRLTTLFCILYPPNFGQGELTFGSQQVFAGFITDKGQQGFQSEDDKVIELDFSISITGPFAEYPGA